MKVRDPCLPAAEAEVEGLLLKDAHVILRRTDSLVCLGFEHNAAPPLRRGPINLMLETRCRSDAEQPEGARTLKLFSPPRQQVVGDPALPLPAADWADLRRRCVLHCIRDHFRGVDC